jgi:hypothetical protein
MTDHQVDDFWQKKCSQLSPITSSQQDLESSVSVITAISWNLKKRITGSVEILNLSQIGIHNRHFLQEPRRESDLGD